MEAFCNIFSYNWVLRKDGNIQQDYWADIQTISLPGVQGHAAHRSVTDSLLILSVDDRAARASLGKTG